MSVETAAGQSRSDEGAARSKLSFRDVGVSFGPRTVVHHVSFDVRARRVVAIVGPSASGKTSLLRAVTRLFDESQDASVHGTVSLDGQDIYGPEIPVEELRRRIGLVSSGPSVFPKMSIFENVTAGLRLVGVRNKKILEQKAVETLEAVALWDSVKSRLRSSATSLSEGEVIRLCLARALALDPEVLLLDETTSVLDPVATEAIEELVKSLKEKLSVLMVTQDMQQAERVSDDCAFLLLNENRVGELVEFNVTQKLFYFPNDPRTIDYLAGRDS
jgi:phosphate transport system ATP-binding protein